MPQPHNRVYNFSAGPSTLPNEVLEEIGKDLFNYKGHGMSVMEMSHRSKVFEGILAEAEADLRKLLSVPENYKVLFLQGGASLQNSMIPICFLGEGQTADYIVSGAWGKKSLEAACIEGNVNVIWDGKADRYNDVPSLESLNYTAGGAYVHYTSNETIQGVQFKEEPGTDRTWVVDMSSDILSKPIDISKYSLIYAGAQKNMGPAGVTVVIIRDELLTRIPANMAPMLDYRQYAENGSMPNTPPTWSIYVCGLVYKHVLAQGGLEVMQKRNEEKSAVLYNAVDNSEGFYKGHAKNGCRSTMNVTFTLRDEEIGKVFVKEAAKEGFDGLGGHRSVGGVRASIYNAFPREGCEDLAKFMKEFAQKNG